MSEQRNFLKDPGEAPTEGQRETERNHEDWVFNVKTHSLISPLYQPPLTYQSIPLTEQDVVGLFNQLTALGVFPGIKIYATSQTHTYDCLVKFECDPLTPGLQYISEEENPLGISPRLLGKKNFGTSSLTLEFKNNLDGLMADFGDSKSRKAFKHVDICVCWSQITPDFKGYEIEELNGTNYEDRSYPGATHLLHKEGDTHIIQVIMLQNVLKQITSSHIKFQSSS